MLAAPKPASPKPAVVIAVAAAKRLMFFTSLSYHAIRPTKTPPQGHRFSGLPVKTARDWREQEVRITTSPGDYVFIPPYMPHREENPHADEPALVVVARTTQEAIVVNLPQLYAL
jgi:hypothetical protein